MYHNHHEDHHHDDYYREDRRYRNRHGHVYYSDRYQEHNANAESGEYRTDEQWHDSEERYVNVVPLYEEQTVEKPWPQEPFFAEPAYSDSYVDERYSDARYVEEHLLEDAYIEDFYIEEPNVEEFYSDEAISDDEFRDEHFNEMHNTEHYRDPEIHEYSQDRAGVLLAEDFVDTQYKARNRFTKLLGKIGVSLALALLAIGAAAFTMFANKPHLTPAEIVQLDGYKGQVKGKTLYFNLASLRGCDSIDDCDGVVKTGSQNKSAHSDLSNSTVEGLGTTRQAAGRESVTRENTSKYREIPAVATPESQTAGTSKGKDNQWKVRQQWSIVRETPARNGAIVSSLEVDQRVTVIKKNGEWYEITTDDNSSSEPLGFMHKSLLQPL